MPKKIKLLKKNQTSIIKKFPPNILKFERVNETRLNTRSDFKIFHLGESHSADTILHDQACLCFVSK